MSVPHAIFITAFDRPHLLDRTLESWDSVRGIKDWAFVFRIEPSHHTEENKRLVREFVSRNELPYHEMIVNPHVHGVLHHPWVGFTELFRDFNFVVRSEDDLCVSDDILEYLTWAELTFRARPEVATIHAYTDADGHSPSAVNVLPEFNPWVWGTWRDRWNDVIGPTWDHDYSTFNGSPGNQSGWDWNLNTRIFPARGLHGVVPRMSRVDNIGVQGTHSTPENFRTAPSFRPTFGVHDYQEV
jgi:hypothetical protein